MYTIEKNMYFENNYAFVSNVSKRYLKHTLIALEKSGVQNPVICRWTHRNTTNGYSVWISLTEKKKRGDIIQISMNLSAQYIDMLLERGINKEQLSKETIYIGYNETDEELEIFCDKFIRDHNWELVE